MENYTIWSQEPFDERQLLIDSRKYAVESRLHSWFELLTTLVAFCVVVCAALMNDAIAVRLSASLLLGLLYVRIFAIYHDYMHSSIFKDSPIAGWILKAFALLLLTPPSVWKRSHDHHHNHNSKLFGSNIGSFPIMTVREYKEAKFLEKFEYHLSRNPFSIFCGYFVVFLWGMCTAPLISQPRKHSDSITALLLHVAVGYGVAAFCGWNCFVLLFALPILFATGFGSYLFYVQHNFPGAFIEDHHGWTYTKAALFSSSHLVTGRLIGWFTASIGLHQVHHLNSKIPFYRLAEAYEGLPPLQLAIQSTLSTSDVLASLQLKLWDEDSDRFISFKQARGLSPSETANESVSQESNRIEEKLSRTA